MYRCVLAGTGSIRNTSHVNFYTCLNDPYGFECQHCQSYCCMKCLILFWKEITETFSRNILLFENDPVLKNTKLFLEEKIIPSICHACGRRNITEEHQKSRNEDKGNEDFDDNEIQEQLVENIEEPISWNDNKATIGMVGDGLLIFSEFGFSVDTPLYSSNVIDVHGLGEDKSAGLKAPLHMVMSPESARKCHEKQIVIPTINDELFIGGQTIIRNKPFSVLLESYYDGGKNEVVSEINQTYPT